MDRKTVRWRNQLPLRVLRARYLVITTKGFRFAERQYRDEHVLSHLARSYPPFLKLSKTQNILDVGFATRTSYDPKIINQAFTSSYVQVVGSAAEWHNSIYRKITEMTGDAPREIYA